MLSFLGILILHRFIKDRDNGVSTQGYCYISYFDTVGNSSYIMYLLLNLRPICCCIHRNMKFLNVHTCADTK